MSQFRLKRQSVGLSAGVHTMQKEQAWPSGEDVGIGIERLPIRNSPRSLCSLKEGG